jgi:DNA polymerase-3 subunit epsilon
MRQIVLDTETTGLEAGQGHRIIEIGAVELLDRRLSGRHFHHYLNPERPVDPGAFAVHGLSDSFLADKPRFGDIAQELVSFIQDAELRRLSGLPRTLRDICTITDSLVLARQKHPGQKNSLDALCRRYHVDNSARTLHGALLDAEILADVYLLMTGGQTALFELGATQDSGQTRNEQVQRIKDEKRLSLRVIRASDSEHLAHERMLDLLDRQAREGSVWRRLEAGD